MMLPALSVKQPYATMIAGGEKTIETRCWATHYRGPLVICSTAMPQGFGVTRRVLCLVFLRHCRTMTVADQAAARCEVYDKACSWVFDPERRIVLKAMEPIRGSLGIFGLCLPELEFFTPEERDQARRWLDWSQENGYLRRLQEWQA